LEREGQTRERSKREEPSTIPFTDTGKQEREIRETEFPWSENGKQEKQGEREMEGLYLKERWSIVGDESI
jgi:hypothetical protein